MTKIFFFLFIALILSGCVNRRGISATYYNDCHEYFDSQGYYHKDCDPNVVEFKDIKKMVTPKEEVKQQNSNVW